jgi:hypothetical protein
MAEDLRKHVSPISGSEAARRASITALSMTINDIVPVASTTERNVLLTNLIAAGHGPTSTKPLYVDRTDLGTLERHDGTNWLTMLSYGPWRAYTPTAKTNSVALALGNGTVTGRYQYTSGTVTGVARFTFGSSSGFNSAGSMTLSLPVAPVGRLMFGTASGVVGGAVFNRFVRLQGGSDVMIVDAADTPVTNTAPGTWVAGNYVEVSFTYDAIV